MDRRVNGWVGGQDGGWIGWWVDRMVGGQDGGWTGWWVDR